MLQAFIPHVGFIVGNGSKLKFESNNHWLYAFSMTANAPYLSFCNSSSHETSTATKTPMSIRLIFGLSFTIP